MDTRPSQNIDFRARNRAKKRYRQVGEHWVKGKEIEGAWVPAAASKKFASVGEAVEHEMSLTKQRRASWTNLIKGQTAAVQEHVSADGEKTRAEVCAGLLCKILGPDDDNATAAQLRMRQVTASKLYQDRINERAAQERAAEKHPRTDGAAGSSSDDSAVLMKKTMKELRDMLRQRRPFVKKGGTRAFKGIQAIRRA